MNEYIIQKKEMFQRAATLNCIVLSTAGIGVGVIGLLTAGIDAGLKRLLPVIAVIVLMLLFSKLKLSEQVKALILSFITFSGFAFACAKSGFSISDLFIMFLPLVMTLLYFERLVLLIYEIYSCMIFIITAVMNPNDPFGIKDNNSEIFVCFGIYIGFCIYFYMVSLWADINLKKSVMATQEGVKVNERMQGTIEEINETAQILDQDVLECDQILGKNMDGIKNVTVAVKEMTQSIQENADSLQEVNRNMTDSLDRLEKAEDITIKLEEQTGIMTHQVEDGVIQMGQISGQVKTIEKTVSQSGTTMEELNEMLQSIHQLLLGIYDISDQTNLLSLNASIEAARAGEYGKGFAVVAEQVQVLASESAKQASNISDIVSSIDCKIEEVLLQGEKGKKVVESGTNLTEEITFAFTKLRESYEPVKSNILQMSDGIKQVNYDFESIGNEVINMSDIAQKNAVVTKEILVSMEEQTGQNQEVKEYMDNIIKQNGLLRDSCRNS